MRNIRERGSIMVEALAVIALLGVMGTMLFRQVQQRNEELDNINMASETRMVKEATAAYIQANKPALQAECQALCDGCDMSSAMIEWKIDDESDEIWDIDAFLPEHWRSDPDEHTPNGIIGNYTVYMRCYMVDANLAPRKAIDAFIIPQEGAMGDLTLKRAARVANLIGSDGGIHISGESILHGTMGAWEVDCPDDSCDDRDDHFFVATTGVDVYVPEPETEAMNTVAVPHDMAFGSLHSQDYFSVGANCVRTMNGLKFPHEELVDGEAVSDDILRPGNLDDASIACDPLFWVSVKNAGAGNDNSKNGQVYVREGLYVGRKNAGGPGGEAIQAFALEPGQRDETRQLVVYSTTGDERLILDAKGQVIGRSDGGKGYKLDAENGEIVLFNEAEVTINGETENVQIPVMRLKNGAMETNKVATYPNDSGTDVTDVYKVDPAYTSVMNDIRLTSRGGARLSDILPNYIAKEIYSKTYPGESSELTYDIEKPTCPKGYVRAVTVTPVSWSQYVTDATLSISGSTGDAAGAGAHNHSINVDVNQNTAANTNANQNRTINATSAAGTLNGNLQLIQKEPVNIKITDNGSSPTPGTWTVKLKYGQAADPIGNPTANDPITALVQTYCVYDEENFDGDPDKSAKIENTPAFGKEAGTTTGSGLPAKTRSCSGDADCLNTESCVGNICTLNSACSETNGTSKGGNTYCIGGIVTTIECLTDEKCSDGEVCKNYRCISETAP